MYATVPCQYWYVKVKHFYIFAGYCIFLASKRDNPRVLGIRKGGMQKRTEAIWQNVLTFI
jgi:hypothetical protein